MKNVIDEHKSDMSTVPYEASDPIQDNWAIDCSGITTNIYLGTLPSPFERAIDYFDINRSEIEKAFQDRFVAIWEDTIIDSDADFSELAGRVYGQYGYVPIYMPFVGRRPKARIHSPKVKH